jgi:hypothetical protein
MRYKAIGGVAIVAVAGLAAFAAIGLGRDGGSATATSGRPTASTSLTADHKRAGSTGGIVYRVGVQEGGLLDGENSAKLGTCPKKSLIINGALATSNPAESSHLTIRGSGILSPHKWFVDYANDAGSDLSAFITVVCKKTG